MPTTPVTEALMTDDKLERLAGRAGMYTDLMRMGAGSLLYSQGCHGVTLANMKQFAALVLADALDAKDAEIARLNSEQSGLLKLARYGAAMLHWHRGDNPSEIGDVDAITCQEEATRCGVLEGRNVDGPCSDQCECAPFDGWDVCYFMPTDVRAEIDRLDAARATPRLPATS